jgi:hypothetical protein
MEMKHNLDPEARIASERVLHELRPLAGAPERRGIRQAIAQRPSGRSLRVIGRGMQTNSVRMSSALSRTVA